MEALKSIALASNSTWNDPDFCREESARSTQCAQDVLSSMPKDFMESIAANKNHVYHYHAMFQKGGATAHLDGIVFLKEELKNFKQYKELKKVIEPDNFDGLTINSITYLGLS